MIEAAQILNSFLGPPGAYLHVPFCGTICPFCPYNKVRHTPALVDHYFAALAAEVALYARHLRNPFSSLYIGGGTPSLCLEPLAAMLSTIPVAGERAIEVYPQHATLSNIRRLQQMGINYISLGVQSFNAAMLRYLQRPASPAASHRALANAVGQFDCVDVDLIFDVAFADESVFLGDMAICLQNGVDQISTYPLMRFGYTPFGKARHDSRREHRVLRRAERLAARFGYERRSVWTFNRRTAPSYSSITRPFYLGLGAGSASYTGRYFLVNHFGLAQYLGKLEAGQLPLARQIRLPPILAAAYWAFWQAYTGRVDPTPIRRYFGSGPGAFWRLALALLRANGQLESQHGAFFLTPAGRDQYHDLERWVTYRFIEPLWSRMMREHTVAVSLPNRETVATSGPVI